MPINCNKFNLKINQSRFKRFPRQVNVNNNQQIGVNNNVPSERNNIFGSTLQSGFDAINQGVKDAMHHMSVGRVIFPGHTDERKGRQLNSNIYSQAQDSNNYNYNLQAYRSQPWYAANKEYYDKYYENYYQNYYPTTTSPPPSPIRHQYQQPLPTHVSQTLPNRSNNGNTLIPESNQNDGQQSVYIDENGLFQITSGSRSSAANVADSVHRPVDDDDDAIVFQSDESRFNGGRTRLFNGNNDKQSQKINSNPKSSYFDGLPVFSN